MEDQEVRPVTRIESTLRVVWPNVIEDLTENPAGWAMTPM